MAEVQTLVSTISGDSGNSVLFGDLNMGPDLFPGNFAPLLVAGLRQPYVQRDGRCSYCVEENPLLQGSGYQSGLIDHVMPKRKGLTVTSARRSRSAVGFSKISAR